MAHPSRACSDDSSKLSASSKAWKSTNSSSKTGATAETKPFFRLDEDCPATCLPCQSSYAGSLAAAADCLLWACDHCLAGLALRALALHQAKDSVPVSKNELASLCHSYPPCLIVCCFAGSGSCSCKCTLSRAILEIANSCTLCQAAIWFVPHLRVHCWIVSAKVGPVAAPRASLTWIAIPL